MEYGVIMAGGAGTRLWPMSRSSMPKQLLRLVRGKSLLELSYERLRGLLPPERIFVCTAAVHRDAALRTLPELPAENLLGEPEGRDTANAVGFPAAILHARDKDAVAAVVTADHVIEPVGDFCRAVRQAFAVVQEHPDVLVTFGIKPTYGHPGLGYIHRGEALPLKDGGGGAYWVRAFKEKPDKPTADRYVETGRYYWNSGMFVWRCDTVLNELARYLPTSHAGLTKIAAAWDTPNRQAVLNEIYPALPKISIDFAVMERVAQSKDKPHVATVEMPVEWLDVGSWPALAETIPADDRDNSIDAKVCCLLDCNNNIIISSEDEHLVAGVGVNDMVIVHTRDITLFCARRDAQRVKELLGQVKQQFGDKYL